MNREEFEQKGVEYALGLLAGEEREQFESYLRTATAEERSDVRELLDTASMLPLALERSAPPARVKERLLEKVRLSAQAAGAVQARRPIPVPKGAAERGTPIWRWVAFGALAAAVILAVILVRTTATVGTRDRQLAAEQSRVSSLNAQLIALKDELSRKEAMLQVLASRRIAVALMNGLQVNPAGYGKVIWDPDTRTAILQVSRLPAVPENKDYQLWVLKGKTPVSAGVFSVSDTSSSFFKVTALAVANPSEISAFAVTLEPKGGVSAPTGAMYLAGPPKL